METNPEEGLQLQNCNCTFTMAEVIPFILDLPKEDCKVPPSRLNTELLMPWEERLKSLCKLTRKHSIRNSANAIIIPDVIIYQNYKPHQQYKTKISIRNMDKVSRGFILHENKSPYFRLSHGDLSCGDKVAPGIVSTIHLTFIPDRVMQYYYEIIIISKEDKIIIPVYALGPIPILNVCDHVTLPPTVVKQPSTKTIIIRNIGQRPTRYIVHCTEQWNVSPKNGILDPNEISELKITCKPPKTSSTITDELTIFYGSMTIAVKVECQVTEADVCFEDTIVLFEDAFMGLKSHKTLTLINRSDFTINFQWKMYESQDIDEAHLSKIVKTTKEIMEAEKKKFVNLQYFNIVDGERHAKILERTFKNEVDNLDQDELLLYKNEYFEIIPMTGQVFPHQKLDFTVIFSPTFVDLFNSIAYLDVTGVSKRLPAKFIGTGRGPEVILNLTVLDLNKILLKAHYNYEVLVKNEGHIPATVKFLQTETDFGSDIHCTPNSVVLTGCDDIKPFVLHFTSDKKGHFIEKVQFEVEESKEILYFLLKGNVVSPTVHVDRLEIDLGRITCGGRVKADFNMINHSQVAIDFNVKMDEKYFCKFEPQFGIIESYSSLPIQVIVETTEVQKVRDNAVISVADKKEIACNIVISYESLHAKIQCTPQECNILFGFINYSYARTIKFKNTSDVYCDLTYTPAELPKGFLCSLDKTCIHLDPMEESTITLNILGEQTGIINYPLNFSYNCGTVETLCKLKCNISGPIINLIPMELEFGSIRLLQSVEKPVKFINDSPIPADVTIHLISHSFLKVDKKKFVIRPESSETMVVTCFLRYHGRFEEVLSVDVADGETITMKVTAIGVGHSILISPNLAPKYDAENLLTHHEFKLPVTFTNLGKKFYTIQITREMLSKLTKEKMSKIESVFEIHPPNFNIEPNRTVKVELKGHSKKPKAVSEEMYCYAVVEKNVRPVLVTSFTIRANFIDPSVSFLEKDVHFKVGLTVLKDNECSSIKSQSSTQTDIALSIGSRGVSDIESIEGFKFIAFDVKSVTIRNDINVKVKICLTTSPNFLIMTDKEVTTVHMSLEPNESVSIDLVFRPIITEKRFSLIKGELVVSYYHHPKTEVLCLNGEIYYPTVKIPEEYDFGCVHPGSYSKTNILIENLISENVEYKWELVRSEFYIKDLPEVGDFKNPQPPPSVSSVSEYMLSDIPDWSSEEYSQEQQLGEWFYDENAPCNSFIDVDMPLKGNSRQMRKALKRVVFPLLDGIEDIDGQEGFFCNFGYESEVNVMYDPYDWKNIFHIEPWTGYLKPYEFCSVNVSFTPPPNVAIRAVLECNVEHGEKERIVLKGASSKISFSLDKDCIEFEHKFCNEICEDKLTVTNTGIGDFTVTILCDSTTFPKPNSLNVIPQYKLISPNKKQTFIVKYYPGVAGEFKKNFQIAISYLEPLNIMVHGYATFSQVSLSLPRPSMNEYYDTLGYRAISSISIRYLKSLHSYGNFNERPDDLPEPDIRWLLLSDWVILSKHNVYPSADEIDLAIERLLYNNYLTTIKHRVDSNEFVVPDYELNFGAVALATPVCYTIKLLNIEPDVTSVILQRDASCLEKDEFKLELSNKTVIKPGESLNVYVIFKPTRNRFTAKETIVRNKFKLKIKNGPVIVVNLKAIVTIPTIKLEYTELHFGPVLLGQALRRSILMSNNKHIPSNWSTEVISTDKKKPFYYVIPSKGRLEIGQVTLLNIYFIPTSKCEIVSHLNIQVEGNVKPTVLKLTGEGCEPLILLDSPYLKFTHILPFTKSEAILNIQNVSEFPLEICFSDFDKEFQEEKYMVQAYLLYNKLDMVLGPKRVVGTKLIDTFQGNYYFLLNQFMQKLYENVHDGEKEGNRLSLNHFTQEEIFPLIKDYIDMTLTEKDTTQTETLCGSDDAENEIGVIEQDRCSDDDITIHNVNINNVHTCGAFIVFHGAPFTEWAKISNRVGIALSMPVYDLDRMIFEEIVANECSAAENFIKRLDDFFHSLKIVIEQYPEEDEYEYLVRKYKLATSVIVTKGTKRKTEFEVHNGTSKEILSELIKKKLNRFKFGLILENLCSRFFKGIVEAFECVLIAAKDVPYFHVIILHYTIDQHYEDQPLEPEVVGHNKRRSRRSISINLHPIESMKSISSKHETLPKVRHHSREGNCTNYKEVREEFENYHLFCTKLIQICENWDRQITRMTKLQKESKYSARSRHLSGRKRHKSVSEQTLADLLDLGIPLWFYNTQPSSNWEVHSSVLIEALKNFTDFSVALNNLKKDYSSCSYTESITEFTVYTFPKKLKKLTSTAFEIMDNVSDSKSLTSLAPFLSEKRSRRKRKSAVKDIPKNDKESHIESFKTRVVVPADAIVSYKVKFSPTLVGSYKNEYNLELTGLSNTYKVVCDAHCHLPEIDFTPEKVFPNVLDNIGLKSIHDKCVYVKDKNTFYFGPILVGTNKTPSYRAYFQLKNVSKMPCELLTSLDEFSLFSCEPETNKIPPNTTAELVISTKTFTKRTIMSELYISIKNNPKVYTVNLHAKACAVEVNIYPKSFTYEVPVNYCAKGKLELRNNSIVDLWWSISKETLLFNSIKFIPTNGHLKAYSVEEINIEYKSDHEENIKFNVEVQIFDLNCSDTIPVFTENVLVQANAVRYLVEYENHIDLGEIPGRTPRKYSFQMTNKGKNPVYFRMEPINANDSFVNIRTNFLLTSSNRDWIQPGKVAVLNFHYEFKNECKIEKLPVYICHFTDDRKSHPNIYKTFYIYISGEVFLSRYDICPTSVLYFGYQQLLCKSIQTIEFKNVGHLPFAFSISSEGDQDTIYYSDVGYHKSKHSPKVHKSVSQRQLKTMKTSIFTIYPIKGELHPKESVHLTIECIPEEIKEYEETIRVHVSSSPKDCNKGEEIHLFVTGAEPKLELRNPSIMFRDYVIVRRISEFVPFTDVYSYCFYVTSEKTLYIQNVCINTEEVAKIFLFNISPVIAKVTVNLHHDKTNFSIKERELSIDASQTKVIDVSFKPDSLGVFESDLDITYNRIYNNSFRLHLVGKSCVPQIKLLKPDFDPNSNSCVLSLPLSFINEPQTFRISVQNVGETPCKIIFDLRNNEKKLFHLKVCEDTVPYLNLDLPEFKTITDSTLIKLNPLQIGNVDINYCSENEIYEEILLKIHVANNPFEIYNVTFRGRTYYSEILLKDVPVDTNDEIGLFYKIDFGNTVLHGIQKRKFILINNSQHESYKFVFTTIPELTIIPKMGHLNPKSKKEIIFAVFTNAIINLKEILSKLEYIQIEYETNEEKDIMWDDRLRYEHNILHLLDSEEKSLSLSKLKSAFSDQIIESSKDISGTEPNVNYRGDEWNIIPILFSINASFAMYKCSVDKINFPVTNIQEKSKFEFKVYNVGKAPVDIDWKFDTEILPFSSSDDSFSFTDKPSIKSSRSFSDIELFSAPSLVEEESIPFDITPTKCTIPNDTFTNFTVTFKPTGVQFYQCRLKSSIPCLDPSLNELNIEVSAQSVMPHFYFEMEDTDLSYVSKTDSSDIDGKVIMFETIGVGKVCMKTFNLVNLYDREVNFEFQSEVRNNFSYFSCMHPSGSIKSNKKFEMSFKFHPMSLGTFEEKFIFSLADVAFSTVFLLIGTCREAKIFFADPCVTLPDTIPGVVSKSKICLRNCENIHLNFKFSKESLTCNLGIQKLTITPMSGKINPKTDYPIEFAFNGIHEGTSTFVVKCMVDKAAPIVKKFSVNCLQVKSALWYIKGGRKIEIHEDTKNVIEIGNIPLNKKTSFKLIIENTGKTGLYFKWLYDKKLYENTLAVTVSEKLFVPSMCSCAFFIHIEPLRSMEKLNFKLTGQIAYGKSYSILLKGSAKTIRCKFSFTFYDFRACVIQKRGSKNYNANLELRNFERSPIMVENFFENSDDLTVDATSGVIPVNSTKIIPIYFHPQKVGCLQFNIPLTVDANNFFIKIKGEGIMPNVLLSHSGDKFVDLGKVKVGTTKRRKISVFNRGPFPVKALFYIKNNLAADKPTDEVQEQFNVVDLPIPNSLPRPSFENLFLKSKINNLSDRILMSPSSRNAKDMFQSETTLTAFFIKRSVKDWITVYPQKPINMEVNKKYDIVVEFQAKDRIIKFDEKLYYEIGNVKEPLCVMTGSCISPSYNLDKKVVIFSNVVIGYKCCKEVVLQNDGDVIGRFRMVFDEFTSVFSVTPEEGIIKPNTNRIIYVTFAPNTVQCHFLSKVHCLIEEYSPLELILTGNSTEIPSPIGKLEFSCPIGEKLRKTINISNPTITPWDVSVKYSNNMWNIIKQFEISPEHDFGLEIEYAPLQFTSQTVKDMLYIELPEGQLKTYELEGKTLPPLPIAQLTLEFPCKQWHTEILQLENKTNIRQCYKVSTQLIGPVTPKSIYRISGLEMIEVLPNQRKNYPWHVFVMNEIPMNFRINFASIKTQDYLIIDVNINPLPSKPLDTIKLVTIVRKMVEATITLKNPLLTPVVFDINCDYPEVVVEKRMVLEPSSSYHMPLYYCPLSSGQFTKMLEVSSDELGVFLYNLQLTAKPPPLEERINFQAELGERGISFAEFVNKFGTVLEFTATFDNPAFSLEKPLIVLPGNTGKFTVAFTPTKIGVFQGLGVLSSPLTGDYTYPLVGKCIPPTPKGPFYIPPGGLTNITFTNPFNEQHTFAYKLVSKYFKLKIFSELIGPRRSTKIPVTLSSSFNTKCTVTGRLIVTCNSEDYKDLVWTFYLQSEHQALHL